jgi:hypothetical protein
MCETITVHIDSDTAQYVILRIIVDSEIVLWMTLGITLYLNTALCVIIGVTVDCETMQSAMLRIKRDSDTVLYMI